MSFASVFRALLFEGGPGVGIAPSRPLARRLTPSTEAPLDQYMIGVAEHGAMLSRWKWSRCAPIASATTVLIGSACDTATMTPKGWRSQSRVMVEDIRACISRKLSPPGNRKPLGCVCTVDHSG